MSRISFNTVYKNKNVEVVAGWDHPMQTFFLDIIDDNEELIYSSMMDIHANSSCKETHMLEQILVNKGIHPPDNFWSFVNKKQRNFFCKM